MIEVTLLGYSAPTRDSADMLDDEEPLDNGWNQPIVRALVSALEEALDAVALQPPRYENHRLKLTLGARFVYTEAPMTVWQKDPAGEPWAWEDELEL